MTKVLLISIITALSGCSSITKPPEPTGEHIAVNPPNISVQDLMLSK